MTNLNNVPKISFAKKVGYSVGGATDTLAYDFVAAFLLFFLTDFAGVNPVWAGSIITIGVFWDMITDPIIGHLSDKTKTRFGKKRTWLLAAIFMILISYLLLFTRIDILSQGARNVYFLVITLFFWLSYTCFSIPYYSIGASMTMDNNERTKIRMLGMIIQYVGVFFSTVAPPMFVSMFMSAGMSNYNAWHYTAWLVAALCTITLIIVFIATKGVEIDFEPVEEAKRPSIIKDFKEILTIKPFLIMTASSLAFRVGYCFFLTTMTYFLLYVVGLKEIQMTACTCIISFGGILIIALLMRAVVKIEKAKLYMILVLFSGAAMLVFNFVDVNSIGLACLMACLYVIGSSAYWGLNIPMAYDSIEVDEFQTGIRREGSLNAIYLFAQKAGYGIAAFVIGKVLASSGYDETLGAQNPESVLHAIQTMTCAATGIAFIISSLIILAYPLRKEVYDKLYAQLELKRAGKPYNTDGFAHVLKKKYR